MCSSRLPSVRLRYYRELDVSCNKLEALPPEIGKCSRLRKLRANGNYMQDIPAEVGHCLLLEVGVVERTYRSLNFQIGQVIALLVWMRGSHTYLELVIGNCANISAYPTPDLLFVLKRRSSLRAATLPHRDEKSLPCFTAFVFFVPRS